MATKPVNDKTYLLVARKGTVRQVVGQGLITIVQSMRTRLKKEPQWRGWSFDVRTPEGFRKFPQWVPPAKGTKKKK